jgi:O-antigen/teichoic acid export membrane protein
VGALVVAGAGVRPLAAGYVAAAAAGTAFYAVTLARVLRDAGVRVAPGELRFPFRDYFGFSLPLLSTELVHLSITTVSVVVLGFHAGVDEVAEFRAVRPAALLNQLAFTSFVVLFRPLAARLHERGDHATLGDVYWQTAVWLAVASFPVLAMTGPFAEQTTVTLFGADYRAAGPYLAVLAAGYYLNAALGFNAMVLQIFGRIRYVVGVNLAVTAANVALTLALVPSLGAMGASLATTATLVALNVASQAGLARGTGIGLFRADYGPVYASAIAAAGALWLADAVLHPPFPVAVALAGAASVALFAANRDRLRVGDTFPEVRRVPVVGRCLS